MMVKSDYPLISEVSLRHLTINSFLLCMICVLSACHPGVSPEAPDTPAPAASPTSLPTPTEPAPSPTPLPSPTAVPIILEAVVWETDPVIPILNYHRFTPNFWDETSGMVRYLGDLQADLQSFYDSGYTLISLDDLLNGNIHVPEGRCPLILTIDDAYFANQFALDEHGDVSRFSAVGAVYQFSLDHPDFGFELAMFANFGDKHYGNRFTGDWWYVEDGWQQALAETIAWGLEHHVYPYNHTYTHPPLDQLADDQIQPQLAQNDERLREYLAMAGHPEYASLLSNYVALPYGKYPAWEKGRQLLTAYQNPEGQPVRAIFAAGYEYAPAFAQPPFADGFDPMRLPRMAAIPSVLKLVNDEAPNFPSAQTCSLTLPTGSPDLKAITEAITKSIADGLCPEGVYVLEEGVFLAREGSVEPFIPGE